MTRQLRRGAAVWPFVLFAAVMLLSWSGLRQISVREFRAAQAELQLRWLLMAVAATAANVTVMGAYDVIAFRRTRASMWDRWRFGVVAFAWSNFLTLGPFAGPAIRFWLYRSSVDDLSHLRSGIALVTAGFLSGLLAWLLAAWVDTSQHMGSTGLLLFALLLSLALAMLARAAGARSRTGWSADWSSRAVAGAALVGWLDWLLAAVAFAACLRAAGHGEPFGNPARPFFLGQGVGLASLVPGGLGSSDAYWITHLTLPRSVAAAAVAAYRAIYYVLPWALASLTLLVWATTQATRRVEVARRIIAGLVGGVGALMVLSSASPALHARLIALEHVVPLPLVEAGQVTAALAGLVLMALGRGLACGYRAAYRGALMVLAAAGVASILKGLDWEETVALGIVSVIAASQSPLFDRRSQGRWLQRRDLILCFAALTIFVTIGALSYHLSPATIEHLNRVGYRLQATRFLRTAVWLALAVAAATVYVLMRIPVAFERLSDDAVEETLQFHRRLRHPQTNPMLVATRDKAVFREVHGFCLYRVVGPCLMVFGDPAVAADADRAPFLDALEAFARHLDRDVVFYQVSLEWMPILHDRGHRFFKLGEQADIPLGRVTLDGHTGKLYRQIVRRAERDGLQFRVIEPGEVARRIDEFAEVSCCWLSDKEMTERQFSVGRFDGDYLSRFRCAVVEEAASGRLVGFANLLEGPAHIELSVDLMRYRSDGPQVMDFLITSLLLEGRQRGYARFNLGMAPLAAVGDQRGAHLRERIAYLIFQRGQRWYNFQGLRQYKQKFQPDWMPRYMAYQAAWRWPVAAACASALIAGRWGTDARPTAVRHRAPDPGRPRDAARTGGLPAEA